MAAYRKSKGSEAPGAFGRGLSVELLYAVGSEGDLVCVETATGRERWRRNRSATSEGG